MDVGVQIDQYQVVEHIGRGGMADVWSARDTRLNRTVAIKTIGRDLSQSQEVDPVKLFEREAQTIAQLEHPHILPIYGFGDYQGQLYIVMRYVTGGSLEDLLADGPLPVKEVIRLGQAIAKALDYAHSNKVVHLDLKPSNILLDSNQSPYLADFGLATVLGPEGRAANPGYGTLLYMAPEQLTASVLDHRADVYSFTILIFHMLTGELPFDATTSLALKQIQMQEELPEMESVSPNLPPQLTPILRRGTAVDVDSRPNSLSDLVAELESSLETVETPAGGEFLVTGGGIEIMGGATIELSFDMTEAGPQTMAQREAQDIYNRARRAWAHGHGNFLLGVTHFMLMNDYYMVAEQHGLELDEAGIQMLLRGALEYDHEVDYWWNRLDDVARRWVALHAIRSDNAPARVRALYRLETLPDDESKQIPRLIAQALQVETNPEAKRAALHVLGTRAQLMTSGEFRIVHEQKGRLLTATTRLGIQMSAPALWREVVYTPEIDLLLAYIAMDFSMPAIAELAARTIGRIRSLTAVAEIAQQQKIGTPGALRALALVRDEAPSLPPVVSAQGRIYAWLANTWRRLTDRPMQIVLRYVFALIGGWLGMGYHVFSVFRTQAIFSQVRIANTIAMGLTFGVLMGFLVLLAGEFSSRLRGFWPWWARLILSLVLGSLWGMITWGSYSWLFLGLPDPAWDIMFVGGLGTALGFVVTAMLNLRGWQAFLVTVVTTFTPLFLSHQNYMSGESLDAILPYDFSAPEMIFTVGLLVAVFIALGGHALALWQDAQALVKRAREQR